MSSKPPLKRFKIGPNNGPRMLANISENVLKMIERKTPILNLPSKNSQIHVKSNRLPWKSMGKYLYKSASPTNIVIKVMTNIKYF